MGQTADPRAPAASARAPAELRVHMLGAFRLELGTLVLDSSSFRLRSAGALFKLLALTPGHRLHRDQLADALWPQVARPAALRNLRYALHSARRTLDAHRPGASSLLARKADQVALEAPGGAWVDALAFEAALSEARRSERTEAYRATVDLYRGDLLPEDRYEDWATGHRERLRVLLITALTELAKLHEARGEAEAAIVVWRRSLSLGSADERTGSAERLFTGTAVPAGPERRGNTAHAATRFVGREREMAELRHLLRRTRLLTLVGPGGIGKTRLALEIAAATRADHPDGAAVVELGALAAAALVPQALASALGMREDPRRPLPEALAAS